MHLSYPCDPYSSHWWPQRTLWWAPIWCNSQVCINRSSQMFCPGNFHAQKNQALNRIERPSESLFNLKIETDGNGRKPGVRWDALSIPFLVQVRYLLFDGRQPKRPICTWKCDLYGTLITFCYSFKKGKSAVVNRCLWAKAPSARHCTLVFSCIIILYLDFYIRVIVTFFFFIRCFAEAAWLGREVCYASESFEIWISLSAPVF